MNKKGQMLQPATGLFITNLIMFGFVTFGMVQLLGYMWPGGGAALDELIIKWFGGVKLLFLFVASGLVGIAINEISERLLTQAEPLFTSRIKAFFVVGAVVVIIGLGISALGTAGIIPASTVQSMILP